jgi:hypothetical protein
MLQGSAIAVMEEVNRSTRKAGSRAKIDTRKNKSLLSLIIERSEKYGEGRRQIGSREPNRPGRW